MILKLIPVDLDKAGRKSKATNISDLTEYIAVPDDAIQAALNEVAREEGFQIGFRFDPDEAEIERQKQYFAEQKEKARRNHMKFSKTRLYQREVAAAFREMFRREFS
mgnify:CR=1 FL=1